MFLFFLGLSSGSSFAQCLEYEEMDGPECFLCGPPGWGLVFGSEEILDVSFNQGTGCSSNAVESPSGGTVAGMHILEGTATEGYNRTWTGLTPGNEYTFIFWWLSLESDCQAFFDFCCADLSVSVDGVETVYSAEYDWTLLELCIEAVSDEITIEITGLTNGQDGYIYIDDAECSDGNQECCALITDINSGIEVCPNEDLIIEGEFSGEMGTVNIEWTSDPADGINYLDDINAISPIFNFPSTDQFFSGSTFTFTLIVEDDSCESEEEIEIEVLPFPMISFDFEDNPICSNLLEYEMPTTSLEGIEGTWDVEFIEPINLAGIIFTNTFTPNVGQSACITSTDHGIEILETVDPNFNFPLEYCRIDGGIIDLPGTSLEGIEGAWNIPFVDMDSYADGPIDIFFTPDDSSCAIIIDLTIILTSGDELSFNLPSELCTQDAVFVFPTISIEGINGSWDFLELDPSQDDGFINNTFTPDANANDCYSVYYHTIEVLDAPSIEFDIPLNLCSTDNIVNLENTSLQGYNGQWSPSFIDPASSGSIVTANWTPDPGQSPCVVETELVIQIDQASISTFNLPQQICNNQGNFEFPTISTNGIEGTWSIPNIDPSMLSGTVVSIFLPDDIYCTELFQAEIAVISAVTPFFNLEENICASDDQITLPVTSDNGINGSWDQAILNPSDFPGQTVEITFIPNDPTTCAVPIVYTFNVETETTPIFDFPSQICWQDDDVIYQDTSNNDIIGEWTNISLDIENNLGTTFMNTFTPNVDYCASSVESDIMVIAPYNVNYQSNNPSSCTEENGNIEAIGDLADNLFSIDGGITWQVDPNFMNLGGGLYQLLIASIDLQDCILSYDISLTSPNAPSIDMINTFQLSSCNENDGMITIEATGTDLEYSLDGGTNWQTDPTFDNLGPNLYDVIIRAQNSIDCEISAFALIDDFPQTEITNFVYTDITDCGLENGSILIEADGLELEYSIDNGASWSDSGVFNNLPAGQYEIIVQSSLALDCNEMRSQLLITPGIPIIDQIESKNPNVCLLDAGEIEVFASGENLEYSIDGVTWQESNLFENMTAGQYEVLVRDGNQPNCVVERIIELLEENILNSVPDYSASDPIACGSLDGMILFNEDLSDNEYSLDGGTTWQDDPLFDTLSAGQYSFIVRKVGTESCTNLLDIFLQEPECPCDDLILDYSLNIPDCSEDVDVVLGANFQINTIDGSTTGEYSYEWNTGEETQDLSFLSTGQYSLTITYDGDCEWIETFDVNLNEEIGFEVAGIGPDCASVNNGSINIFNAIGGSGDFQYSLDGINFQPSPLFDGLAEGLYTVTVMDELGCIKIEEILLENRVVPEALFFEIMQVEIGDTITLDPQIGLGEIDEFEWSPSESIIELDGTSAVVSVSDNTEFIFTYQIGECSYKRTFPINTRQIMDIYIPNVFSPDGDGNNDIFFIQSQSNVVIASLNIYDRWGELMFSKLAPQVNTESDGWNGRFNGQKLNPGVYVYSLSYESNGKIELKTGTVTVVE